MLQPELPWYRDESLLIAWSNVALIALLIVVLLRNEYLRRMLQRATRKVLMRSRELKGVRYALNITSNQYMALKRRLGRKPRDMARAQKPPPRPAFVVPPPLELALVSDGEDPESWCDSGIKTALRSSQPPPTPFDGTSTQPVPIAVAGELLRKSRPPQ